MFTHAALNTLQQTSVNGVCAERRPHRGRRARAQENKKLDFPFTGLCKRR